MLIHPLVTELKLTIVHQALSTLRAQPGVFEDVSILGELSNPRISGVWLRHTQIINNPSIFHRLITLPPRTWILGDVFHRTSETESGRKRFISSRETLGFWGWGWGLDRDLPKLSHFLGLEVVVGQGLILILAKGFFLRRKYDEEHKDIQWGRPVKLP